MVNSTLLELGIRCRQSTRERGITLVQKSQGTARGARGRLICTLTAIVLLLSSTTPIWAQGNQVTEETSPPRYPNVLNEGTLSISAELLYLRDDDDKPIFVPNISMKEFLRLRDQNQGVTGAQFSPFQFDGSIDVVAEVRDQLANIEGTFRVQLGPTAQSAEVPLAFGTVQLGVEPPVTVSENTVHQFLADATGYRWILLSTAEPQEGPIRPASHSITLKGKSRVRQEGDRQSLRISLPVHPCQIQVLLPANAIDERVDGEDILHRKVTERGVELTIDSRGGDFKLWWRNRESVSRVASVEAQSRTMFEIDDPRQVWKATTTLNVRWYGNDASDRFRIRLPKGAKWRAFPGSDIDRYSVTSVESKESGSPDGDAAASNGSEAPIELLVENLNPINVRSIDLPLEWEWTPSTDEQDALAVQAEIQGPSVTGVSLHRGKIDCIYPVSYSMVFTEAQGARLIQQGRVADGFGRQQIQFGFSRQPFNLQVTFRREQSLPTVRPTYQVTVDENKLVMTAWLDCSFDANQRLEVGMVLGDWILQENNAKSLNGTEDLFATEGGTLRVNRQPDGSYTISGSAPETGAFSNIRRVEQIWRLVAVRSWTPDENNELEFTVPEIIRGRTGGLPQRDHGSGVLIITGNDNILLQWQETASTGLLSDSFSTEYQKYVDQPSIRKPLAYRFQSRGTTPTWAGRAELLPQALSVQEQVDLEILDSQVVVTQDFALQVANAPLRQLRIAVRSDASQIEPQFYVEGILTSSRMVGTISEEALLGGSTSADALPAAVDGNAAESSSQAWNVYQLIGAPELLGNARLTTVTTLGWQPEMPAESAAEDTEGDSEQEPLPAPSVLELPLVRPRFPTGTRVVRRTLKLASEIPVELVDSKGEATSSNLAQGQTMPLATSDSVVRARVQPQAAKVSAPVRVGMSWLQTVISGRERRDRFVAKVESDASQLSVTLPPLADIRDKYQVLVDGIPQPDASYDRMSDALIVSLPSTGTEHTLEIFYDVRVVLSSLTVLEISTPQILDAEYSGRFYWQLATPTTEHLCWSPGVLTPEWQWNWGGLWWFRQSSRDERGLVNLLGAKNFEQLPTSANQYLLSGRYPTEIFTVYIASRFMLWFPIGVTAIAVTCLVLNVAFFRKPICGLLLGFVIAVLAMVFPDLGVLLGQTTVISLGLVVLILTTQAAVDSRVRRRSVFTTRPSTYVEGSDYMSVTRTVPGPQTPTVTQNGSSIAADGGK